MWCRCFCISSSSVVSTTRSMSQEKISRSAARITSPKRLVITLRLKSEVVCMTMFVSPSSTGEQSANQVL